MSTIPLFNDGNQPRTAIRLRPVFAPTNLVPQAKTVQITGAHVRAFEQPTVDPAPFVRAAAAPGVAAGEAIQKTGDMLGRLALARIEVTNRLEVAKADEEMSRQLADFERWKMENPDPQGWEDEWARRSETLDASVFHDRQSPAARDAINERLMRFRGKSSVWAATDATKQIFAMEGAHIRGQWIQAAEAGDLPAAKAAIERGRQLGHWWDDDAARMEIEAKNKYQEKARERITNEVAVAHEDPDGARSDLDASDDELRRKYDPAGDSGIGGGDLVRIRNSARAAQNKHRADVLDTWNTDAFQGKWKSDDEVGAAVRSGLMDAEDAQRYKDRRDEKWDDPQEVERLGTVIGAIEKFDPLADPEGKSLLSLRKLMNTLGKDSYWVAAGRLQAKLSVASGAKHEHKGAGMARDALRTMAASGAFGQWKKEVWVDDPAKPGEKKKTTVVDQEAKRSVILGLSRAIDEFDKWAQNPQNANKSRTEAVREAMKMLPKNPADKKGAALFLKEAADEDEEEKANGLLDEGLPAWDESLSGNKALFEGGPSAP